MHFTAKDNLQYIRKECTVALHCLVRSVEPVKTIQKKYSVACIDFCRTMEPSKCAPEMYSSFLCCLESSTSLCIDAWSVEILQVIIQLSFPMNQGLLLVAQRTETCMLFTFF